MKRYAVQVEISSEVLRDSLHLPVKYEMKAIKYDPFRDVYNFIVTGEDLPEWKEGNEPVHGSVICHYVSEIQVG